MMVGKRLEREPVAKVPRSLLRVVTVPQNPAWNTFAQRQEQMYHARVQPQRYVELVVHKARRASATSERVKAVRRSLPQQHSAPTPHGRRRGRRKGFLWRFLSLLAVSVIIIFMLSFAFTSNTFRITQVNVVGTRNDRLISAIEHMGMQGKNIFLINVESLTKGIDSYPLVASAILSKQWPNRLTVTVVERTPVLLWQTQHETYTVDSEGVVIALASETSGTDRFMTVIDTRDTKIQPGTHVEQADIAFATSVFKRLPEVTGITAFKLSYNGMMSGGRSFVVESPQGWLAYLGDANDVNPLENRLIELQQILVLAQQQHLKLASIDVRYGLHPVFTLIAH